MGDGIGMRVNERREIRQVLDFRFINIFKESIVEYACARSVREALKIENPPLRVRDIKQACARKIIYITLIWDMRY